MKIDVHTHILPEVLPPPTCSYKGWLEIVPHPTCPSTRRMQFDNGDFFRDVQSNCFDPEVRILEMLATGVTKQILSTVPVLFNYWAHANDCLKLAVLLNNHIAEVCKVYPDHFDGLGTVPMQDPNLAIAEMKRCLEIGLVGLQIGTHVNEWTLDNANLKEFFHAADEMQCPLFIHPWDMDSWSSRLNSYWGQWLVGMPAETTQAACSLTMGGILKSNPTLKVALAHGCGSVPYCLGRIEHGHTVRPDLCAWKDPTPPSFYFKKQRRIWADSLVHSEEALRLLVSTVTGERVMLGSDYPFPLGESRPGELIQQSALSEETKKRILYKNAEDFFNIKISSEIIKELN